MKKLLLRENKRLICSSTSNQWNDTYTTFTQKTGTVPTILVMYRVALDNAERKYTEMGNNLLKNHIVKKKKEFIITNF